MIIKKTTSKDEEFGIFPYKAYLSEADLAPLSVLVQKPLKEMAKEEKLDGLTLVFVENAR